MTDMLLVYTTCKDMAEAEQVGKHLMDARLCACVNIFPNMHSRVFWPPQTGAIEEGDEVVLIAKTIEAKYEALEAEINKITTYETACIFAIPVKHVTKKYYDWLVGELA